MKSIDNKKAPDSWRKRSFNVVTIGNVTMISLALSFNEVNFSPVERDGQIWLTASELATALGYAKTNAVIKIKHLETPVLA